MLVKDLKKRDYFKIVNSNGLVSKKVYILDSYDRSERKYLCYDALDINGFKYLKPTQKVSIDFEY